jgi:hypothetical protein
MSSPPDTSTHRPVVFLHGLCSSPRSAKATFFSARLAEEGRSLAAPDLNRPTFDTLTLTAQVEETRRFLDTLSGDGPVVLIGSSLGGLVALLFAHQYPERVQRILLIAPATRFVGDGLPALAGTTLEGWRQTGYLELLHHADNQIHRLGFQLKEDAARYDFDTLQVPQPILLIHGTMDEVVPYQRSLAFAAKRPNVRLIPIEGGDHQLGQVFHELWQVSRDFLVQGQIG